MLERSRNLFQVIWELFPDEILERLLEGVRVKTDNDRLMEVRFNAMFQVPGGRLVTNKPPSIFGLYVKNFMFLLNQTSDENSHINAQDIPRDDIEVLYPETTKNFDRLPILYRVSTGINCNEFCLSYMELFVVPISVTSVGIDLAATINCQGRCNYVPCSLFPLTRKFCF
jgi:hypothetical protein